MHAILKTVATFEYAHFAHLAKAKLESEDVECFIFDEITASMNWFYTNAIGGIKLKVRGEDYQKALKILNETSDILLEDFETYAETEIILCPKCNSGNVVDEKYSKKFKYLSILLFGLPLLFRGLKYKCENCGNIWRK